jgi:hypothetical protein
MLNLVIGKLEKSYRKIRAARQRRRWEKLQRLGMQIGKKVTLPA